jgi:hypothetical protein
MLRALGFVVLLAALLCPRLARAEDPTHESSAPVVRDQVVLRIVGELGPPERLGLTNLLTADFRRHHLRLVLEASDVEVRRWIEQRRSDPNLLLLAILEVQGSSSWQLSIVDAARGRAIARTLPGGVRADAAALEAVASIVSSAASALSDGLEVASLSIDEVVAAEATPPVATAPTSPRPAAVPAEPPVGVESSLGAVISSFTAEVPAQLGFSAALGLRLGRFGVRASGARYLPAQLDSSFGSFSIGRTAFALAAGRSLVWGRLELEAEAALAVELLRRSGAHTTSDEAASPDHSLFRVGPALDLRGRYRLGEHLALEGVLGGCYFPSRVRFLAENPAATPLSQPWSGGVSGQLGIEVRAP